MTGFGKRALGLLLMLSSTVWASAICPMMLIPAAAKQCAPQDGSAKRESKPAASEHECCPRAKKQSSANHLSACASSMSCCAVEREPATAPKSIQTAVAFAVLGRVILEGLQIPSPAATLESANASPPIRGVLSLKEDLRI